MRPDDTELAQLLPQFVPVRIVDLKGVDLRLFRFDYDLTFAALMMSAEGETYSRFGVMDAGATSARMSIAGLKKAMRAVLVLHKRRKPASPADENPFTLADIPAYRRSKAAQEACAHCHYAHNFRFAQMRAEGKFSKEALYQYPLPENIGVTLDVDDNHQVKAVSKEGPAARAGVLPGDVIVEANGRRVLTSADLQFVLNDVSEPGQVTLQILRQGKLRSHTLALPRGWRKTDISWRASQGDMAPMIGIWAEPLNETQKRQRGLAPDKMALRVSFFFPEPRWAKTRGDLRMNDILIGIDGVEPSSMSMRQFHTAFRMKFAVGETATLRVLRGEERKEISVPCLDVGEE